MALLTRALAGILLIGAAAGWMPSHQVNAAVLPECGTAALHASIGSQQGGAGSIFTILVLRNSGHATCFVQGYPGISLVDLKGHQLGRAAQRTTAPTPPIVLRPGQAASTMIHTLNPGVGTTKCLQPSAAIRVYPPDQRKSLLVAAKLSECLGVLEVRPLVAGSSGI